MVERLEEAGKELLEIVEHLPLSEAADCDLRELARLAGASEVDAVIRCVLLDHLEPLIASLRSLIGEAEGESG